MLLRILPCPITLSCRFLRTAAELDLVLRIIIDEAHRALLDAAYREAPTRLRFLGAFGVNFVFLSGTMPDFLVKSLMMHYSLSPLTTTLVRQAPSFARLVVDVVQTADETGAAVMTRTVDLVRKWFESDTVSGATHW